MLKKPGNTPFPGFFYTQNFAWTVRFWQMMGVLENQEFGSIRLLQEAGIIDVLNVKSDPLLIGSLRGQEGYFPAYHMNKEKWLSIQLGKPELDDAIKDLLSLSHELTAPKKRNPKSSAKNPGDSANGKEKEIDEG